jgi:hypothetical protein
MKWQIDHVHDAIGAIALPVSYDCMPSVHRPRIFPIMHGALLCCPHSRMWRFFLYLFLSFFRTKSRWRRRLTKHTHMHPGSGVSFRRARPAMHNAVS